MIKTVSVFLNYMGKMNDEIRQELCDATGMKLAIIVKQVTN